MKSTRAMGLTQIVLSAVCFGFLGLFGKQAFAKGLTPPELLSLRFLISGALMIGGLAAFTKSFRGMKSKQFVVCALLGLGGYAVFSLFYFTAVRGLSMSLAVLLLYTYPLIVALGGWLWLNQPLPKSKVAVVPLCFAGTVMLIWGDFQMHQLHALLFGIGAALSYALYILGSSRWLKDINTLAASSLIQFSAGAALFVLGFSSIDRASEAFLTARWEILGLAVVCSILPISLFQLGLRHVQGWEASIFSTVEPVTAILLSVFVLNERFSPLQAAGTAVIFSSLVWVARPERKKGAPLPPKDQASNLSRLS